MTQPRVAVIGTNIGTTLHVGALQAAGFDVVALVGRDAERTSRRAAHFGIPTASTSVEKMIDSDIDAIVVATPPSTHHPIVMAAIAAGKHVLCEKPLAASSQLAMEMHDAARSAGVVHVLQHQLRWVESNAMLGRLVRTSELGKLIQGVFEFDFPMMQHPELDVPEWWLTPQTGGGWLRNYNTHGIDLIRYMIGEFASVSGQLHADLDRGMTADDSYAINFVLADGMQGAMIGSCRPWYPHVQSRVIGSQATAVLQAKKGGATQSLFLADKDGLREIDAPQDLEDELEGGLDDIAPSVGAPATGEGVYHEVHRANQSLIEQLRLCRAFKRRIADQSYINRALADFGDGVVEMRIVEAVELSHRQRRWIDV